MVYATTYSLRCFDCGDLGHKRFACPHRDEPRTSTSDANNTDKSANDSGTRSAEEHDTVTTEEEQGQQEVSGNNVGLNIVSKERLGNIPEKSV